MSPTVVIVDDQPAFRTVAREMLEAAGFDVVGEAGGVADALALIAGQRPDVVLLDVRLPDGSGLDLARRLSAMTPPPAVVLTSSADYAYAVRASGAAGFIPKGMLSGSTLLATIEAS